MTKIRLRPLRERDIDAITAHATLEADPWNHFEPPKKVSLRDRFSSGGDRSPDAATLAVETVEGVLIGSVSWHAVHHGPPPSCRCINMGISLFPEFRGHGYGSEAQRVLADALFSTEAVERVEAGTDVENLVEQRALEKAGFIREGVLRRAQYRAGTWHDVVMYSRLRNDEL